MKALKVSVILMGVLILVGLAVVAITVVKRAGRSTAPVEVSHAVPSPAVAPPIAGVPAAATPAAASGRVGTGLAKFGQVTVTYPAGFEPVETVADGDRLIVRLRSSANGAGRIIVLDLRTGHELGTIALKPAVP